MSFAPIPTIKEVAKLAGVSVATVSKALNKTGNVSEVLRDRVEQAAQTLGYAPHASARSLRNGSTRILALLVADISNPFFLQLVERIEQLASARGYSVMLCNSAEDPAREQRNLQMLLSQRVDGIFIVPTRESWPGRVAALSALPTAAVLVDRALDGLDFDSVLIDNRMAGRLAADHLLSLGHHHVGILMGSPDHQIARHRLEGFRNSFIERGKLLDDSLLQNYLYSEQEARDAAHRLLERKDRPTAVFATNPHLTLGLLNAVTAKGLRVPDDISVIAIDDLPWAGMMHPGLTAVVQPSQEIAEAAVTALLKKIGEGGQDNWNPLSIVLEPVLLARGSTAPVVDAQ